MNPFRRGDFRVRLAEPRDRAACYAVCLGTGDSGRDATHLHTDPEALGHVYVGAYLAFEPELALVLEDSRKAGWVFSDDDGLGRDLCPAHAAKPAKRTRRAVTRG